jgi:hypothetical protein
MSYPGLELHGNLLTSTHALRTRFAITEWFGDSVTLSLRISDLVLHLLRGWRIRTLDRLLPGTFRLGTERPELADQRPSAGDPNQPVDSSKGDVVRPAKAGAFCGRQSHRGKSRSPVAWVAGSQWGNRDSEAYRRAIVRMVASHQAVAQANERWPRNFQPRRPSRQRLGEGNMDHREQTDAMGHSGGVVIDGMVTRTC